MNYKSFRRLGFILLAVLLSNSFACRPSRGEHVLETWETSNKLLKIRVRQFNEKGTFVGLPGYYYAFEATPKNRPDEWHEVATIRTDDDVGIPRDQIRFVNDEVAYLFMNEKYAVTTDSGQMWSVWEAIPAKLSNLQSKANIKAVQINPDGTGKMQIDALLDGQITGLTVSTKDYGRQWNMERSLKPVKAG